MKSIFITLVLAVTNYQPDVTELQSILAPIAPVQIEVIDLANPQPAKNLYSLHYQLVRLHVKPTFKIYLHNYFEGGLSGGKANQKYAVANVAIVPGYDERNTQVIAHELLHLLSVDHNNNECNLMNPQPCGVAILERDVLRARKYLGRRR